MRYILFNVCNFDIFGLTISIIDTDKKVTFNIFYTVYVLISIVIDFLCYLWLLFEIWMPSSSSEFDLILWERGRIKFTSIRYTLHKYTIFFQFS